MPSAEDDGDLLVILLDAHLFDGSLQQQRHDTGGGAASVRCGGGGGATGGSHADATVPLAPEKMLEQVGDMCGLHNCVVMNSHHTLVS
mmetsp:Transcript_14229/g.41485  ORF Transcript_14229/g.41485 Transcript_14229/m.41485 type:complete len:88 (-) Transcript_14229:506-769(-)